MVVIIELSLETNESLNLLWN